MLKIVRYQARRPPSLATTVQPAVKSPRCCKQADGWRLEQPEPGVLVWHTPADRTYTPTPTPTQYAA
jgi:hypothetical protein